MGCVDRLLRVQSRSDTPQGSWRRVEWQYDALGRRIRQTTWSWLVQSNLWVVTEELRMVSDPLLYGRHLLELNATNVLVRSYVWGLDLSGTLEGAGGVGGLLWVTLHTGSGAGVGTHFCAYDENGNVVALASASDGSPTARYEYGPFGEPIRLSGPAAANNPFRFSTKRTCNTTDLVVYEYRAYSPSFGRWLSRDPLGQVGEVNICAFTVDCANHFVDPFDLFLLVSRPIPPILIPRPIPVPRPMSAPRPYPYPPRPLPPDSPPEDREGWGCHIKCAVQRIDPNVCPEYVEGWAESMTEAVARRESLGAATQSCPRGCYPRHCNTKCSRGRLA